MINLKYKSISGQFLTTAVAFFMLTGFSQESRAQAVLSLAEAKTIALANSYRIQLSENEIRIAQSSTKLIQAGYKPTLGLNSAINGNLNNSSFKYFNNPERATNWGVPSLDVNVGAAANYLLWDGKGLQNKVAQRVEEEKAANISLQSTKESIVFSVENVYLNVARLYENRALLEESINISQKRKLRAQYSFDYGSSDKLALLNAEVDLNRDSVDLLKFNQTLINAKRNLNLILNRDYTIDYTVDGDIEIEENLSFEQFFDAAISNNLELQQARQNLNISAYDKKINDSNLKPLVLAKASYGINFQDNTDKNIVDYSIVDGLRVGLSATWNIADGGRTKQLNQLTDLKINAQQIFINQIEDQISLQITNAWGEYQNALLVYDLEQKSVTTANENFVRTEEKFKNGQINSITFRQAQLNLLLAKLNLASAKYDAKLIELDLRQLSGILLKG